MPLLSEPRSRRRAWVEFACVLIGVWLFVLGFVASILLLAKGLA